MTDLGREPLQIRSATMADEEDLVRVINAAFVVERFFIERDRTDVEGVRAFLATGEFLVGDDAAGRMVACAYTERRDGRGTTGLLSVLSPGCRTRVDRHLPLDVIRSGEAIRPDINAQRS